MSESLKPTNDKLVDLFDATLDALIEAVGDKEKRSAADLRVAMDFLKNQGISSNTTATPKLNLLNDSLPFTPEAKKFG